MLGKTAPILRDTQAGAVRVHHAPTAARSPALKRSPPSRARHAPYNLVPRHARVHRRHHAAPLVAGLVQIGVADAAEQNLHLHIVFGRIAPLNGGGGKRRACT